MAFSLANQSDNKRDGQRRLSDYDLIGNVLDLPTTDTGGNPLVDTGRSFTANTGRRQSVTRVPINGSDDLGIPGLSNKRGSFESELSLGSWMGKRRYVM